MKNLSIILIIVYFLKFNYSIKYNSSTSNYESNHLSLILPTDLSWLSTTLNVSDTITENSAISGLSVNDISGNVTDGFYFTTSTAPATDTTPYYWVFDVITVTSL